MPSTALMHLLDIGVQPFAEHCKDARLHGIRCVRAALQRIWELQDKGTLAGVEVLPRTHPLNHCRNLTPSDSAATLRRLQEAFTQLRAKRHHSLPPLDA